MPGGRFFNCDPAPGQRTFEELGIVCLPRAVEERIVGGLCEELLAHIATINLVPEPTPSGFTIPPSSVASVPKRHCFKEIWGARVTAAVDELLGAGSWNVPKHAGQILSVPYPIPGASWALPHKMWHLDYRAPGAVRSIPGLQLFLCVDRVEPRSGATLVAAGTPRLIDAIRRSEGSCWPGSSADVRRALSVRVPWFRELSSLRTGEGRVARFMLEPTPFDGGALQVVELTGEPGDVWVMHPWMVHNMSPNCGTRPRLVLTERIRCHDSPR